MMYKNQLVAAIKSSGKILREFKDTVYLPYGCEYSLLLKNLNSVRAIVNIQIDGQEVVPGGLVLYGNTEVDLERFVKDQSKGNRFKFIERTAGIEQHRGIKADDGLVRIEFQFEKINAGLLWSGEWPKEVDKKSWPNPNPWDDPWRRWHGGTGNRVYMSNSSGSSGALATKGMLRSADTTYSATAGAHNIATTQTLTTTNVNDTGITVPGSISEQKFVTAGWFPTEDEKHVLVLRLLGETNENEAVRKPVTVRAKPKCQTCGRVNKATSKFCSNCGTSLEVI